ncbi:hypothetical protein [Sulfobacillus thermosulfidooxidans]|uniref:hypothetical protein n=1 Tax=Sulfobacillus thermosulfidooxidans TaxID=28034 RepID=UPI0003FB451B|nr:hypothetical protein [Sulfobacillus thermosulfidooxidans]
MKHLGQLLLMTCEEPQVSPSLLAAIRLGYVGGIVINPAVLPSAESLQDIIWLLHDTAKLGNQPSPVILLDTTDSVSSLWPLPSLRSMAVAGLTDDVHRLLNTMALIWRQMGITGILSPTLGVGDKTPSPWTDKRTKYLQLWVRELRQAGLQPFIRIVPTPSAPDVSDALIATIDSGLGAAILDGHEPVNASLWRDSLNFRGLLVQDFRFTHFDVNLIPASIANGLDMIILPSDADMDESYRALLVEMNRHHLSKRKIYSALTRIRMLKEPKPLFSWSLEVSQRPINEWAQNIWNHALVHTGPVYSPKVGTQELGLIEFGKPSPLKSLLQRHLAFYHCLDIDPDVRDLFQIHLQSQKSSVQLVIHLNDAWHHLNQSLLFPLCQPRPLGVAMHHPADLFLLPRDATGLTNFDTQLGAFGAVASAIIGKISIHGQWPNPQEVTQL